MSKRSRLAHIVLVLSAGLLFLSGCPPTEVVEPFTATPKPACDYFTSKDESARAANGSSAVVSRNTCVEPAPPAGEKVSVTSYRPQEIADEQWKKKADELGRVYAMLDIKPEGRAWNPPIKVSFRLDPPAPRDNFRPTIYRWVGNGWTNTDQQAVAEHKNDRWAEGEIDHTSLFALIDTTDVPIDHVVVPRVLGSGIDQAIAALAAADLTLESISQRAASGREQGTVLWQNPLPGSKVDPGTPIRLVIAFPPGPVADFVAKAAAGEKWCTLEHIPSVTPDPYWWCGCDPDIQFVNQSSDATSFFWDFGDGEFSTDRDPRHTYETKPETGRWYTVTLEVVGPGGSDANTRVDYIYYRCIG